MIFRRRFSDLVSRQLDVFAADEAQGMLSEVRDLKATYDRAPREQAEDAYGDYMDAIDAMKDALVDMRNRFATTLDGDAVDEYEAAFERAAKRRWRWLA